jgi:hypothetical protein
MLIWIIYLLVVHLATMFAHNVEFNDVEHLAELLEFVFFDPFFGLAVGIFGHFKLRNHALKTLQVSAILDEAANVDLSADEIANIPTAIE